MVKLSMLRVQKFSAALFSLLVAAAIAAFLVFPARYLACVADGISLWAIGVLPAALPFLFLTGLFSRTPLFSRMARALSPLFTRLFRVSGAGGCAALLSLCSGYPAGAKAVEGLCARRAIAREERLRCACLATTSGPAFLVGVAGCAMAGDPALGWLLFFSHTFGVFGVCALLGRGKEAPRACPVPLQNEGMAIPETIASSVLSVLTVGGAVALFYTFGQMVCDLAACLGVPAGVATLLTGFIEMTAGCSGLLVRPTPASLALAAFLVTLGGACVLVQQWSFLAKTGIPFGKFFLIKCAQAAVAALVCYPLALLLM